MQLPTVKYNFISRISKKISPHLKDKKTVSYFTISLSLFSLSFFGLFAIRPTLITAVSLINDVRNLRTLNLQYENKISDVIKSQAEYEKVRDKINLVDYAVPKTSEFQNLARGFETFAVKDGVFINQMQIDRAPISVIDTSKELQNYNFILTAMGNYSSIKTYLSHLINWKRIVNISSLDFSREGGTVSGNLRITMKGSAYYEP